MDGLARLLFIGILPLLLVGCVTLYPENWIPSGGTGWYPAEPVRHESGSNYESHYHAAPSADEASVDKQPLRTPIRGSRSRVPEIDPISVSDSHLDILREQRRSIRRDYDRGDGKRMRRDRDAHKKNRHEKKRRSDRRRKRH